MVTFVIDQKDVEVAANKFAAKTREYVEIIDRIAAFNPVPALVIPWDDPHFQSLVIGRLQSIPALKRSAEKLDVIRDVFGCKR